MSAALWCAYLLIPVAGWGLFAGVPLGWPAVAALTAVAWVWAVRGRVPGGPVAAAAVAAKLAALLLVAPHGFGATYFANDTWTPPRERSLSYRGDDVTRVDARLSFGAPGRPDLPLYFFNDHTRFNFYQRGEPTRATLPFAVVWDGYVWVDEGAAGREFYLEGRGVAAELAVDGVQVARLAPSDSLARGSAFYPKGWRHVVVRLSAPTGAGRAFEAGTIVDEARRPLGDDPIYRAPVDRRAAQIDSAIRIAGVAIDALLAAALGWLVIATLRQRAHRTFWPVAWIVAVAEALWFALPAANRVLLQPGGDDSLTYESQARDIVLNGPLMLMGAARGQAEPFYYQPLYGYVIAAVHQVFGEDLWGLFFVQRLLLFVTLVTLVRTTRRLFGERTSRFAAAVSFAFLYLVMDPWARTLWNETVFVPLTAAWTLGLVAMAAPAAGLATAVVTGLAGGFAVLGRSTLLLAVLVVLPVLAWARRRSGLPAAPLALMVAVMLAVVSLAALRNWVASGQFVPVTTSFGVNLYLGNTPPDGVPVHDVGQHAVYAWFAADDRVRASVEYARHAPAAFVGNLWRKLLYAMGIFDPLVPGTGWSPVLVGAWLAAALGAAAALRRPATPSRSARALPLVVAMGLLGAVVIIFPSHARLILPIYVLLLPYIAVAGAAVVATVGGRD